MPERYGGEEFALIVPNTDLGGALALAERLRATAEGARWPRRRVTISIGVCGCTPDAGSPRRMIVCADAALYRSKKEGRNRVTSICVETPR